MRIQVEQIRCRDNIEFLTMKTDAGERENERYALNDIRMIT